MKKIEIQSQPRQILGRKVKSLRKTGLVPAHIFGNNISPLNIQLETKTLQKILQQVGESTLITLSVTGEKTPRPVFIREIVNHPVTGDLLHISFNQVDLKQKVTARVPVKLVGEPPAEKEKLGIMVQQLDELEVESLPTDMPESIEVDVSGLAAVGQHIKVSDLKLDKHTLTIETLPDTIIVKIEELAKEEVVVAPAAEVAAEATPAGETNASAPENSPKTEAKPKPEK